MSSKGAVNEKSYLIPIVNAVKFDILENVAVVIVDHGGHLVAIEYFIVRKDSKNLSYEDIDKYYITKIY